MISPCAGWARRLGYVHQAVALRARARRCRVAWQPHVLRCQQVIVDAMAGVRAHRRAVVLGSGLLIEVPVAALAAAFDEVVLVDAVHLLPERWRLRRWPHVRTLTADVTGVAAALACVGAVPDLEACAVVPSALAVEGGFDFAVSANLLTQLPLLPLAFLEALRAPLGSDDLTAFARTLVVRHLALLRALAPVTCLITDQERWINDGDRVIVHDDLLYGVTLPPPDAEWLWQLAPRPEFDRSLDIIHRVTGYRSSPLGSDPAVVASRANAAFATTLP